MTDSRPIGVFDSGVGGLTVLHELHRVLPREQLIYLADLAHFPYGPRQQSEVRDFALRIIDDLTGRDCKLVVIACNTATAAALNRAREVFDIPIVGVIAPGAEAAAEATRTGRVGVISTEGTHRSQEYVHAIKEANPGISVVSRAMPELVELVEAGLADSAAADLMLQPVVDDLVAWGADTLVLGCTHYPLLAPALDRVVRGRLAVVDSAVTTAARVARILDVLRLSAGLGEPPVPELLVTASPGEFARIARMLFRDSAVMPTVDDIWAGAAPRP